jgi:small multidrug resistance pump
MPTMGYLFLALAITGEVIATTFLKFTSGEKVIWWAYVIVGVGYVFSFWMLSLTLSRGVPLGIAYAVWAGVGVVLVAIISWLAFGESLTWQQLVGMGLVVGGVVLLELGARHEAAAQ